MNVTDAGRQRVATLEFASQLRDFLAKRRAEGVSEKLGIAAVNFVALALAGRDPRRQSHASRSKRHDVGQ